MALINANLSNYEEQQSLPPLPAGWYAARVVDSEIKQGPKGAYINWEWEIEEYNRKVWDIISLSNDISLSRLKTMATCCGHKNPNYISDTEELHGLTCMIKLKIEKSEDYGDKNRISGFKSEEKQENVQASSSPAKPKMPWEKPAQAERAPF